MRMLMVAALIALAGSSIHAAVFGQPDEVTMIEEIRGRKFAREVTRKIIKRESLREMLRGQMEKGLTVPPAEYIRALRALHLLGDQERPLERLLDLYEAQVLA